MARKKKKHPEKTDLLLTNIHISPFKDMYHWLMTASWPMMFFSVSVVFLFANFIFAILYSLIDGLSAPCTFLGYFFFSVHTIATVGYGNIFPVSLLANVLVTLEIMLGLFMAALMTGIVFSKFSKPTAKVEFSRLAVVSQRNGMKSFNFRIANSRGAHIAEATVKLAVVKEYTTPEGEFMRKLYDLNVERSQTPLFIISWSVYHPLSEDSPLYDLIFGDRQDEDFRIIVSLTGFEPVLGQTVHVRHMYSSSEIRKGMVFKDAVKREGNLLTIDYDNFHEVKPQEL